MVTRATRCGALLLLSFAVGCTAAASPAGERAERGGRGVLTSAELQSAGYSDMYTAVQSLRPEWLRVQGATSFMGQEQIVVYLDGNRMGGVDSMRQLPAHTIASARFLSGMDAAQRWGLDHGAGAILLFTR
jgi:hypothetical protein